MGGANNSRGLKAFLSVVAIASIIALMIVGAGCGSSKKTTPTTTPTTTPKTQPSTTPSSQGNAPIVLTGSGTSMTRLFSLSAGLVVFQIRNSGTGTFTTTLMDSAGKQISVLADVDNPMNGSTALGVTAGQYKISVVSGGSWEVDANQNVPVNPQYTPLFTSGTGPIVTPFFRSSGANATATMTYAGTNIPFVVTLLTSKGAKVLELANTPSGPFNGQKTVTLEQNMTYVIDIEAGGPWTLNVQ
ncbi:MAG: hypothetical protein ACYC99_12535 [Candidatus Geothermincolia bacterium]